MANSDSTALRGALWPAHLAARPFPPRPSPMAQGAVGRLEDPQALCELFAVGICEIRDGKKVITFKATGLTHVILFQKLDPVVIDPKYANVRHMVK